MTSGQLEDAQNAQVPRPKVCDLYGFRCDPAGHLMTFQDKAMITFLCLGLSPLPRVVSPFRPFFFFFSLKTFVGYFPLLPSPPPNLLPSIWACGSAVAFWWAVSIVFRVRDHHSGLGLRFKSWTWTSAILYLNYNVTPASGQERCEGGQGGEMCGKNFYSTK